MAEFKSRYQELGFYVNGTLRNFRDGRYVTEDRAEIEVLSGLIDAVRVDEPVVKNEKKAEDAAPAPKAPAKKASAK